MILGSKHVGAILNVLIKKNICALVGVVIKWFYEMHGATMKINKIMLIIVVHQQG